MSAKVAPIPAGVYLLRGRFIMTFSRKNVSPANVEALLTHRPLRDQALGIVRHQYSCALHVLDSEGAPPFQSALAQTTDLAHVPERNACSYRGIAKPTADAACVLSCHASPSYTGIHLLALR
jgi:hypothetical protein